MNGYREGPCWFPASSNRRHQNAVNSVLCTPVIRHATSTGAPDFERPGTTILHAIDPVRRQVAHMIGMLMGQEYFSHVAQGDPGGMVPDLSLSLNIRFSCCQKDSYGH